jgi:hypothetical protein
LRKAVFTKRWLVRLVFFALFVAVLYRLTQGEGGQERLVLDSVETLLDQLRVVEGESPGRRDQRVQLALETWVTDPVTLRYSDLPRAGVGRSALLLWARLLGQLSRAELSILQHDISLSGERARAIMDIVMNADSERGPITDQRTVELGLVRSKGAWKVERIDVSPATAAPPEARP